MEDNKDKTDGATSGRWDQNNNSAAQEDYAKVLEQVASALSHDVRTPLRHGNHFLDFFEEAAGELPNEAAEHLGFVRSSLISAADMVETLVRFARLAVVPDRFRMLNLSDLLVEAMSRSKVSLEAPTVSFSVSGTADVSGDEAYLLSLFMHVFDNAIMFCPEDRPAKIGATIRATDERTVEIMIEDNGPGITGTEASAFRLFMKSQTQHPQQGEGTGLAFARRYAELHGGSLHLSPEGSSLGGAAFIVTLPFSRMSG